ncbi:Fc.00g045760.m01.CDS01 [Cosmosporella sp. VM-42]
MRFATRSLVLTSLVASASATGYLLPLYVYPSAVWNDGAANWKPALDAISSHSSVPWLVVVNPGNGPGATGQPGNGDQNYISGVSQLNSHTNVKTVGYVRTNYGTSSLDELKANITTWSKWSTYTAANVAVKGIFFDETIENFNYLNEAITFARQSFSTPITTICNFGAKAAAEYYGICDVVIAFESYLNHVDTPQYKSQTTLDSNVPQGYESQAAILVHHFTGSAFDGSAATTSLLSNYISVIKKDGIGWCYFGSGDYDTITTTPATVGEVAKDLS